MKKLLLPVVLLSALALSGATVPAVATVPAAPATVEAVQTVTADSGAVLTVDTVTVTTTPAPAPTVEPVATAPATTAPVATAPAVTATVEPTTAPVAPVATAPVVEPVPATTAPAESYVAPAPSYTCMEDEPCWDCATMGNGICGNPACKAANKFTVTKDGQCSFAPIGKEIWDLKKEGEEIAKEKGYVYAGAGANSQMQRRPESDGYYYIESPTIPGVIYIFQAGLVPADSTANTADCNIVSPLEGGQGAWAGSGTACKK